MTNKDILLFEWEKNVKITTTKGDIFICNTEDAFDKDDSDDEYDSIGINIIQIIKDCGGIVGNIISKDEMEDIEVLA